MTRAEAIEVLREFDYVAAKLLSKSYVQRLPDRSYKVSLHIERINDGTFSFQQNADQPSEESLEAFILHFRKFYGKSDLSSIRTLRKVYESGLISAELSEPYLIQHSKLNEWLDAFSGFFYDPAPKAYTPVAGFRSRPIEGLRNFSRKDLLNVFLFGAYAHEGHERETFRQLEQIPLIFAAMLAQVEIIMKNIVGFIGRAQEHNREVLAHLQTEEDHQEGGE